MTDISLMQIAKVVATNSKCERAKVGAVIVKDKRIIATGYNGTPRGTCNECEENNVTKPTVIHAELNAILNATTNDLKDSTIYLTLSPCIKCAPFIVQKGITKVVYSKNYRNEMCGLEYLLSNNVKCEQL